MGKVKKCWNYNIFSLIKMYTFFNRSIGLNFGKESLMSGTHNFVMTKTFPWKQQANKFVLQAKAAGIIEKIVRDNKRRPDTRMLEAVARPNEMRRLTLVHLRTTFFILCGGLVLSGIVLLIEILFIRSLRHNLLTFLVQG